MKQGRLTLEISGDQNRFENCTSSGPVKISGKRNVFCRFKFRTPNGLETNALQNVVVGLTVTVIGGLILYCIESM